MTRVPLGSAHLFIATSNATTGTGSDGTAPTLFVCDLTLDADQPPMTLGTNQATLELLSDAGYPAGCYKGKVNVTSGNGFTVGHKYGVFGNLVVDSVTPSGAISEFLVIAADQADYANVNAAGDFKADLTKVLATALTESAAGLLAAALKKFLNVATPLLTCEAAMRGTDGANTTTPPTTAQIAAAILVSVANKLATDATGRVTVGSNADKTGYALTAAYDAAKTAAAPGAQMALTAAALLALRGADADTHKSLSDQLDRLGAVNGYVSVPTVNADSTDFTEVTGPIVRGGRWPAADDSLSVVVEKSSGWPAAAATTWTWKLLFSRTEKGGSADLELTASAAEISDTTITLTFAATPAQTAQLSGAGKITFHVDLQSTDADGIVSYYPTVAGTAAVRDATGQG